MIVTKTNLCACLCKTGSRLPACHIDCLQSSLFNFACLKWITYSFLFASVSGNLNCKLTELNWWIVISLLFAPILLFLFLRSIYFSIARLKIWHTYPYHILDTDYSSWKYLNLPDRYLLTSDWIQCKNLFLMDIKTNLSFFSFRIYPKFFSFWFYHLMNFQPGFLILWCHYYTHMLCMLTHIPKLICLTPQTYTKPIPILICSSSIYTLSQIYYRGIFTSTCWSMLTTVCIILIF